MNRPKFPLGQLCLTPGAHELLSPREVAAALARHQVGDWGTVPACDAHENEIALREGFRIVSAYAKGDSTFWVITEADRSVTTLLLPCEY